MKVRVLKKSDRERSTAAPESRDAAGGRAANEPKRRGEPKRGAARGRREAVKVSPARRVAFEVLRRVEEEAAFASVLLAHATAELRADDRALCYELTLGVLRRLLWLDKLIEHYAGRVVA